MSAIESIPSKLTTAQLRKHKLKPIKLVAAPTAIQPGGYVKKAYQDRLDANTQLAFVNVEKVDTGFKIVVVWDAPNPVMQLDGNPRQFVDGAAILIPNVEDAPWVTMGAPGKAIEGFLWKADKKKLFHIKAEGLGSVERSELPRGWSFDAEHNGTQWVLTVNAPAWKALAQQKKLGVAIWQGDLAERAGLKSISPGWVEII